MLHSCILQAHKEYLLYRARRSDARLPRDQQAAAQTRHVSCIASSVSVPSQDVFFPGVAALPVLVKPKYFFSYRKITIKLQVTL